MFVLVSHTVVDRHMRSVLMSVKSRTSMQVMSGILIHTTTLLVSSLSTYWPQPQHMLAGQHPRNSYIHTSRQHRQRRGQGQRMRGQGGEGREREQGVREN